MASQPKIKLALVGGETLRGREMKDALGRAVREAIPADVWAKCEEAQRRHAAALERR